MVSTKVSLCHSEQTSSVLGGPGLLTFPSLHTPCENV